MQIPLGEFEQLIDERILKRGFSYFKSGAITHYSESSNGECEAIVSGTEDYTVHLTIKNNIVIQYHCDCPYDLGPVCKHVVAVIFELKQDELEFNQPSPKRSKKKRTKSVNQQIIELLKAISQEELIAFVEENCKKDRKFRNYFLASFGHLSQSQSKEFYQKQIQSILQAAKGRDGWIAWSGMKYVVNATQPFIENAEKYLVKENFENVFFISTALLEEMTKALQYGDDSSGDLGYFIDSAMRLLAALSQADIPRSLKKEFFEYCVEAYNKNHFEGWDWHLEILRIASNLTNTESDVDTILNCLESITREYQREYAQTIKLELLRQYKDSKEVEEFIKRNISNPSIREQEIVQAFENKNFDRAIALAKDGIALDEQQKPGLAKGWYDWLLQIALAQGDTQNIIKYARFRLINSFGGTQDYYEILKNNIEPEKWHPFLEDIIAEIATNKRWANLQLIRTIYIKESWWDRLFLLLKENFSLESIRDNEKYLAKDYAPELVELYGDSIMQYVKESVGRNHYQTACRYLRRMKKLGGTEQVNEIIELFRKQYPRRRALMEELARV